MNKKRTTLILVAGLAIIVVMVVVVLAFFLPRGQGPAPKSSIQATCVIGQTVEMDGVQLTVTKSYESRGTDSERPKIRFIFTLARVSLVNKSGGPLTVKTEDFTLLVDGKEISPKPLGYVTDSFTQQTLQKDETLDGVVSWETPTNPRIKYLIYRDPAGKQIIVDLKKSAG